jgi:hypothetical protein
MSRLIGRAGHPQWRVQAGTASIRQKLGAVKIRSRLLAARIGEDPGADKRVAILSNISARLAKLDWHERVALSRRKRAIRVRLGSPGKPRAGGGLSRYKNTGQSCSRRICGNELILEFPTKSMPSGSARRSWIIGEGDRISSISRWQRSPVSAETHRRMSGTTKITTGGIVRDARAQAKNYCSRNRILKPVN